MLSSADAERNEGVSVSVSLTSALLSVSLLPSAAATSTALLFRVWTTWVLSEDGGGTGDAGGGGGMVASLRMSSETVRVAGGLLAQRCASLRRNTAPLRSRPRGGMVSSCSPF